MSDPIEAIRENHARRTTLGSTHYEGCWKHHYVCTVGLLLDRIDAMQQVVEAAKEVCIYDIDKKTWHEAVRHLWEMVESLDGDDQ